MNKLPKNSNSLKEFQRQHLCLLSYKKEFQDYVSMLRKKWKIPAKGAVNLQEYKDWIKKYPPRPYTIDDDIRNMVSALDQPMSCFLPVKSYVIHNDFYKNLLGSGIVELFYSQNPRVFSETDKLTDKKRLFIEIYNDTTLKDVQKIWKSHIEPDKSATKRQSPQRRKPLDNFERSRRIYELSLRNKKHREIGEIIKEEFGGKKLFYDDIAKIIARFRQEIQDA